MLLHNSPTKPLYAREGLRKSAGWMRDRGLTKMYIVRDSNSELLNIWIESGFAFSNVCHGIVSTAHRQTSWEPLAFEGLAATGAEVSGSVNTFKTGAMAHSQLAPPFGPDCNAAASQKCSECNELNQIKCHIS